MLLHVWSDSPLRPLDFHTHIYIHTRGSEEGALPAADSFTSNTRDKSNSVAQGLALLQQGVFLSPALFFTHSLQIYMFSKYAAARSIV